MAIADDISVAVNGDIRWTGGTSTTYTVLAFHRFLQDLADDAVSSGDDLLDITSDTPSDRSTDNIISLLGTYNIDDEVAEHLYDGSISQSSGNTVYSGLTVVGSVESGTELQIIRDDKILNNFWGTGINVDAPNNVIMQIMIKTREGGADIDGQKLRVQARELGDSYAEFSLTAGLGNSTAAVFTSADLNNATIDSTISGWTTITNTEGFQLLDIGDGDGIDEEYYSQWVIGSQTVNDVYERTKWIQARQAVAADSNADVGSNFIVDNATILGQGQSFTVPSHGLNKVLMRVEFDLKQNAGTATGDMTAELYAHSGSFGTSSVPTGSAVATSLPVSTDRLTGTYQTFSFEFQDGYEMTAGTNYVIVIRHADGSAGNNVHVRGLASSGSHAGNRSEETGAWAAAATDDLNFTLFASPLIHSRAGELFRGITHEIVHDSASGSFTEDEILFWGTNVTYDGLANGPFTVGNYVQFQPQGGGTIKNGGKILKVTGSVLTVALEDISGNLLDNDIITEIESGTATTADINGTPATGGASGQDRAGGEGVLLAYDDNGATGDFYIQLISGSAPVDNLQIEGRTSAQTALVNVTVTSRTISPEFIGASTGSNIIGAYGIGFSPANVTASDQFFDLTNTLRQPPNNVTFSVTGLVPSEDRVLVTHRENSVINEDQLTVSTDLTGIAETQVLTTSGIPSDTPSSGNVRVQLDNGVYNRINYTGLLASGFLINGSDNFSGISGSTSGNNAFIAYIDAISPPSTGLSYTAVYSSDRPLFVRVRDGGGTPIKTFESPATFASANASIAAIRTSDA